MGAWKRLVFLQTVTQGSLGVPSHVFWSLLPQLMAFELHCSLSATAPTPRTNISVHPHNLILLVPKDLIGLFVMARLDCLPAELQADIFSYLDVPDVKAIREANKNLMYDAAPALFRSVIACARYQGLKALEDVANHPIYSKCVKEIVFDGTVFVEKFAKDDNIYDRAQLNFVEHDTSTQWQRRARWKRYQMLYQEQEDLKTSGMLLHTLVRALESMPNVTSVVYSPHAHLRPTEVKDMHDLVPVGFTCYPTARSRRGYTRPDHAFGQLIGAISLSKSTRIRQLKIERVRLKEPATECSTELFDMPTEEDMRAAKHLFRNLVDIEINLALHDLNFEHMVPTGRRKHIPITERLANVAELLSAAKHLEHLALYLNSTAFESLNNSPFHHINKFLCNQNLDQYTWPKLQTLTLDGLYAHEFEWMKLIQSHRPTLTSLTLRHCGTRSGYWSTVVDQILSIPTIEVFVLDLVAELYIEVPPTEQESWDYEGHLVVSETGQRNFVNVNPAKESVFMRRHPPVED